MDIKHEENGKKGEFYIEEDGERPALIQYFQSKPGVINIYHTEVAESMGGRGVGRELVAAVVDHARKNSLKVAASCPYAKKVIDKAPDMQDVAEA